MSKRSPTKGELTGKIIGYAIAFGILLFVADFLILPPLISTYNNLSSDFNNSDPASGNPLSTSTSSLLPVANYDEQLTLVFTQDFASLAYNVTAVAQSDNYGYGPAYLLNGLSNTGYWYQVGINWNWPISSGGYITGFSFAYDFFYPNGAALVPLHESFSGTINQGDSIELSLQFSNSSVIMSAYDWNTSASASKTFSAEGATVFEGCPSSCEHFFTGLMTEWYHVNSTNTNEGQVVYSEHDSPIASAWMCMDEYYTSGMNEIGQTIFSSCTDSPAYYNYPAQVQTFSYNGIIESSNGYEFITG